jgi:hypothetical protein
MTGPPRTQPTTETVFLGSRDKQPRAFDRGRRVRVIGENDVLIDVCTQEDAQRYLSAQNAEVKTSADGSIKYIRLQSRGDDRKHAGERHGRSTVTTERVRSDWDDLVGGNTNLQHKRTCTSWGAPAVGIVPEKTRGQN